MTESTQAKRAALGLAALTLAAMTLAGCSGFGGQRNTFTCPQAQIVPELQTLVQLPPGSTGQSDATVLSAGRLNSVTTDCNRDGETGVVSTLTVEITGLRTAPAVTRLDLPYFVVVADSTGNILGKQQFTVTLPFLPSSPVGKMADNVKVHLPLPNAQLGNVYTLVLGFQLTQAQVNYNRAHLQ